ncbi:MAG TPA: hypothetical protein VEM40_08660 [Nitrospirota bacterium]|nr:hypothetical protein [Nitrospirota bacterium]
MISKHMLLMIITLVFTSFLSGCGGSEEGGTVPDTPAPTQIWNGTWVSNKVIANGTMSLTVIESGTAFTGSVTMNGSPCFSTSSITGWTVSGTTVSWSAPGIGNFIGTISGGLISGTYSVTSAGACFGDTGTFLIIS